MGEEAGGSECYSPAKVAAAHEYQDELEAKEAQELVAKEARKVQRAINKELKEVKKVEAQLAKELKAGNLMSKKVPSKTKVVVSKAKKSALTIPKATRISQAPNPLPKPWNKVPKNLVVVDKSKKEVITTTCSN